MTLTWAGSKHRLSRHVQMGNVKTLPRFFHDLDPTLDLVPANTCDRSICSFTAKRRAQLRVIGENTGMNPSKIPDGEAHVPARQALYLQRSMEPFHELVAEGSDFSALPARSLGAEIVVADGVPEATQTKEDKKPTPAKSGSRQVPNSFSPLAFHAEAPLYIPGAKTRIPAAPVTCERICGST
jgi:hypothetical protein